MEADKIPEQRLIEKIRQLVPEQVVLVENFIDSLSGQNEDYNLTLAATKLSEPVLLKIWDNPEDAEYDKNLLIKKLGELQQIDAQGLSNILL